MNPSQGGLARFIATWNLLILLVLLILLFAALKPDTFLTPFTFRSMANSRSINALAALAVMIPLAANHFDLSVASVIGIAQVLANGLQTQQHLPWQLAVLLVLVLGGVVGLINGVLVTRFRISSFIATLGTGTVLLGLNQWYTGGRQVVGRLDPVFLKLSTIVPGLGVPSPLLYVLAIAVVLWLVFDYLPLGRYLYVIGDNPRAATLVGIRSDRYVILAFIGLGPDRRLCRRRPPGPAPGRTEHGRTGADAAGVYRGPAWAPPRSGRAGPTPGARCWRWPFSPSPWPGFPSWALPSMSSRSSTAPC